MLKMPIVDGLTSTKMIRSFEKINPSHQLSKRASLNGRVPIIAVSASLVERERQTYIDAGFDAWILKPISFVRLETLVEGMVNSKVRDECLYTPGRWEAGGWFNKPLLPQKAQEKSTTKSDGDKIPASATSQETQEAVAHLDDPFGGDDASGTILNEQKRLFDVQENGKQKAGTDGQAEVLQDENAIAPKSFSAPQLGRKGFPPAALQDGDKGGGSGSDTTITPSVSITGVPTVSTPDAV